MATPELLLLQVNALLAASSGFTVAVIVNDSPTSTSLEVMSNVSDVTRTTLRLTLTMHDAERLLPSAVVAVIVAVPIALAVTFPLASTVATMLLLLLQVTALLVVFSGLMVAVRVNVSSTITSLLVASRVIDVASIVFSFTVTLQVAERLLPSVVVALICTVPGVMVVTLPLASTVATAVLLLLQVSVLLVVSSGFTVAVIVNDSPASTYFVVMSNVSDCARTGLASTRTPVAPCKPFTVVAKMVA